MRQIWSVAALALCVAALSVAYYFAVYLPRSHDAELAEQRRKADFDLAQRCYADGMNFFSRFQTENNIPQMHYEWDDPEFHYSTKLNTCLVHIRYLEPPSAPSASSFQYNQVMDVYGNRPILRGWFKRPAAENSAETTIDTFDSYVPNYTSTRYFAEKKTLFGE